MVKKSININQLFERQNDHPNIYEVIPVEFLEKNGEVRQGFYEPLRPTYTEILAKISVAYAVMKRMEIGDTFAEERLVVNDQGEITGTVSLSLPPITHLQLIEKILFLAKQYFNKIKKLLQKNSHPDVWDLMNNLYLDEQNIKKAQHNQYYPDNKLYPLLIFQNIIDDLSIYIENYNKSQSNELTPNIHNGFLKAIADISHYIDERFIYAPKIELLKISEELSNFYQYLNAKSHFLELANAEALPSLPKRFNQMIYRWANTIEKKEFRSIVQDALNDYMPSYYNRGFFNHATRAAELHNYLKECNTNEKVLALVFSAGDTKPASLNAILFKKILQQMHRKIIEEQNAKSSPVFHWILQSNFNNTLIEHILKSIQSYAKNYVNSLPQNASDVESNLKNLNRNNLFSKSKSVAYDDNNPTELQASLLQGFVGFK